MTAGDNAQSLAVNPTTNKILVANQASNDVTVIDGATDTTTAVAAGSLPEAVAVNPATEEFYVAGQASNNVTAITVPAAPVPPTAIASPSTGYWLVAADGGIYALNTPNYGSLRGISLARPVVGGAPIPDGLGYWLVASDGGIFSFGDAPFLGNSAQPLGSPPIVAMMATDNGFPFIPGSTGYDISWPQCGGPFPPRSVIAIVGATRGFLNVGPNPCYRAQADWAGANLSSYIVASPLPSPAPPEALTGPYGTCNGNVVCESANFGYHWGAHWVTYSRSLGISPTLWWLDVELPKGWNTSPASQPSNDAVVAGAIAGMRATGVFVGIYATSYQWGLITGNRTSYPGSPLWVPGGTTLSDDPKSAHAICTGTIPNYLPFAGGKIVLVQYGYIDGPPFPFDLNFACLP